MQFQKPQNQGGVKVILTEKMSYSTSFWQLSLNENEKGGVK